MPFPTGLRASAAPLHRAIIFAALSGLGACHTSPSPSRMNAATSTESVRSALQARIAQVPGAQVAIAVRDLESGRTLEINGDTVFHAASTMKVPVLFALYQEFRAGRLSPTRTVRLENRFTSIVDGSPFTLDAGEDSDSSVYRLIGQDVPVRDLARRMITHSSNLATNALIQLLDAKRITALTRELGATTMLVRRGVEDNLAFRAGLNNTATANDLVALFAALESGRVADAAATREMLAILEAQAFNDKIPAGLPPGTRVAHKTGEITATWHDAGLVYPAGRKPYAIAMLTRNIPNGAVADTLIADCSRLIWTWLAQPR
jgi:beta-lactamase class A